MRCFQLGIQSSPKRQEHLRAARVGDVAEVNDVAGLPAEPLAKPVVTSRLAAASLPQMNNSCSPGTRDGAIMISQFTVLSAFTTRTSGNSRCVCSPRESVLQMVSVGGIPFEVSNGFPT